MNQELRKGTKAEYCAQWILKTIEDNGGWIEFKQLKKLGLKNSEDTYLPPVIYRALYNYLGGKIVSAGCGNLRVWYLIEKYEQLGKPTGLKRTEEFLDSLKKKSKN